MANATITLQVLVDNSLTLIRMRSPIVLSVLVNNSETTITV